MQSHSEEINPQPLLVTGSDGYIGSNIIKLLLERGFKVRGTVINLADKAAYEFLYNLVPEKSHNLELVEANIKDKEVWETVTKGVHYIFHVAAPINLPAGTPEEEYVKPAIAGNINVLEGAIKNGVKKVVVTSSAAAVAFNKKDRVQTEDDWEDEKGLFPYSKSKILGERALWEFYEQNKDKIDVSVVNPAFAFGPTFNSRNNSTHIFGLIMKGTLPGVFDTTIPLVDVRDIAEVQFRVMFNEGTTGKRFLCVGESVPLKDLVAILNREFKEQGIEIPDGEVTGEQIAQGENPSAKMLHYIFSSGIKYSNQRSIELLGMRYRTAEQTIIDTGASLLKFGVVKGRE